MKFTFAFLTLVASCQLAAFAAPPEAESILVPAPAEHGADMINLLHQREWVRLDKDGAIGGKLSVISPRGGVEGRIGAQVIISRDGKTVLETTTGTDGTFRLEGLKPGAYALQSRSEYLFAAFALHVLPTDATHLSSDLEIYASVIATERADELIAESLIPADLRSGEDGYYRDFDKDPIASERTFNNSHQVALRDGDLVGRVSRPGWTFAEQDLTGTIAQIVREGEVIAKAAVGKDGFYTVEDLEPGAYDLIVSGDDGFAVLAFEAIESPESVALGSTSGTRLVSTQSGMAANCLSCEMIYQPAVSACDSCGDGIDGGLCAPVMGGGFAGHGGFGGGGAAGGGGGLGGLGGLLGIAGLATGITALADSDEGVGTPIAN